MDTRLAALLLVLVGIPILLWAQDYPQVYYVSGYQAHDSGGEFGGPDWASYGQCGLYQRGSQPA